MLALVVAAFAFNQTDLVPVPQSVAYSRGQFFEITPRVPVVLPGQSSAETKAIAKWFVESLGIALRIVDEAELRGNDPAIALSEEGGASIRAGTRNFAARRGLGPQAYRLSVTSKGVRLTAGDSDGLRFGLQTLRLLLTPDRKIPAVEIEDHPDIPIRGVIAEAPLTPEELDRLAVLKCNAVLFVSDDFYDLGDTATRRRWAETFNNARRLGIEPIPMLDGLGNAGALLRRAPLAAEGRMYTDHIRLRGTDWTPLSRANILDAGLRVRISNMVCQAGRDYDIDEGVTAYPYAVTNRPWRIRRIPGGVIPDGATVDVSYAYAPPKTTTLCPNAPERLAVLRDAARDLIKTLDPAFIHIGHGDVERLHSDARCIERGGAPSQTLAASVASMTSMIWEIDRHVRMIVRADLLNPIQSGGILGSTGAMGNLPEEVVLHVNANQHERQAVLTWANGLARRLLVTPDASPAEVYAMCEAIAAGAGAGVLVPYSDEAAVRLALNKSWTVNSPFDPWLHALNAYFDAELQGPDYDAALMAMINRFNRRMANGIPPGDERRSFDTTLSQLRKSAPNSRFDDAPLRLQYALLADYAELEWQYSQKPDAQIRSRLIQLIETQATLDPTWTPERGSAIIDTIRSRGLFAPSTILFGVYVAPYRPYAVPADFRVLEIPVAPSYHDEDRATEARFDLFGAAAPVTRIDFESAGIGHAEAAVSGDGREYKTIFTVASETQDGVRAPFIFDSPALARYVSVRAYASRERAVLRDVRLFGLKGPATARAAPLPGGVGSSRGLLEAVSRETPDVFAFAAEDGLKLAAVPTVVWLRYSREKLYIIARLFEPRTETMVYGIREKDGPLWDDESFGAVFRTSRGLETKYVTNPLGTIYDSQGLDPGWDGHAEHHVQQDPEGWIAILAVPLEELGVSSVAAARLDANFTRTRRNVVFERSIWAVPENERRFGEITFR